jgi:putative membrane protein
MHGFEGMGWGMGIGWILGLIVLIAIVWLILRMGKSNSEASVPKGKSALEILNDRYARGEIDKNEFEEKKQDLH